MCNSVFFILFFNLIEIMYKLTKFWITTIYQNIFTLTTMEWFDLPKIGCGLRKLLNDKK